MTERSDAVIWAAFLVNSAETVNAELCNQQVTYSLAAGRKAVRAVQEDHKQVGIEIAQAALDFQWKDER